MRKDYLKYYVQAVEGQKNSCTLHLTSDRAPPFALNGFGTSVKDEWTLRRFWGIRESGAADRPRWAGRNRTLFKLGASNLSASPYLSVGGSEKMWDKNDWHQFFQIARVPWRRHRPPRPVYPSGVNRILPAAGFSLSELDDAGINIDLAEHFGLPVDASRVGAYGPNVSVLRDFVRSTRHPT